MSPYTLDQKVIDFSQKMFIPLSRLGLFVVYFWFGFLKVIGQSPASGLVQQLFEKTIPFMSFNTFLILFGLFECLIGILFLFRKTDRVVLILFVLHMITTFMPLVLLPSQMWSGFFVPTLEGQYIIKNLLVISAAVAIAAHMKPLKK